MAAAQVGPARPAGPARSPSPRAAFAAPGSQWPAEPSPPPPPRPQSALHHWPQRAGAPPEGSGGNGVRPRRGEPGGPGIGSLDMVLVLLVQVWALQEATSLSVRQGPRFLHVRQDSQVTLACQVVLTQAWEQLRVWWTKDHDVLCGLLLFTNGNLSLEDCGPRGWLSWQPPGNFTLQLDHVSLRDGGNYVCWAAVEIPELEEAEGNGTQLLVERDGWLTNPNQISFPGAPPARPSSSSAPAPLPSDRLLPYPAPNAGLLALLVAGGVAVAAVALAAWIWGRRRCGQQDTGNRAGNPLYSNVLYWPRRAPKTEAWPVEGKALDIPREGQKGQSFYSVSFSKRPSPQQRQAPRPCPGPSPNHPISTGGVSPGPGPSRQPRPRGPPELRGGTETLETRTGPPCGHTKPRLIPGELGGPAAQPISFREGPCPHFCGAGPLTCPQHTQ
ncbi:LOW QUALITY PROTEIN: transmembrane and immunoglobulin domain-containing protein 2 [Manis pentadactyla]|uniref:LOW QUALITY PROTEIN: transmembrane and immunoglobulin domain-containing protein 2 n=1 Tax=Manis pentadactyla TaxID=143292 RepID=UPI00255C53A0|nr:LOW QUALITY PROTEIN: transmembrane and immunoglobulin domain-containing protein 2 [Manis pentadactyla]